MRRKWRPYYIGLRPYVRDALQVLPDSDIAHVAEDADLVAVDLYSFELEELRRVLAAERLPRFAPRVVLSVLGADRPDGSGYAAEIADLEARVLPSEAPACILRCAPLGQSLERHLVWALMTGAFHGCYAPEGVAWLHAHELAELVELLYRTPERCEGAYDITGPELLSMSGLSELLSRMSGSPVDYVPMDGVEYRQVLQEGGLAPEVAARLAEAQVLSSTGEKAQPTRVLQGALGHASPLGDYLAELVAVAGASARNMSMEGHRSD